MTSQNNIAPYTNKQLHMKVFEIRYHLFPKIAIENEVEIFNVICNVCGMENERFKFYTKQKNNYNKEILRSRYKELYQTLVKMMPANEAKKMVLDVYKNFVISTATKYNFNLMGEFIEDMIAEIVAECAER